MSATFAVVVGAFVGHWYNGRAAKSREPARMERLGTLVASGLIVGESLFGVFNAGLIVGFKNDAPIALVPEDFIAAKPLAFVVFVGLVFALYRWMLKRESVEQAERDDVSPAAPAGCSCVARGRGAIVRHEKRYSKQAFR